MKPTLVVLAAGMGSRYGGLKQMDGLGPNNETIIDYSIYDAVHAGFGKVVYIVRESFKEQFQETVKQKYKDYRMKNGYLWRKVHLYEESIGMGSAAAIDDGAGADDGAGVTAAADDGAVVAAGTGVRLFLLQAHSVNAAASTSRAQSTFLLIENRPLD